MESAQESYEDRRDRERAEKELNILGFIETLKAVDIPGWTLEIEEREMSRSFYFNHVSGARFYITEPCGYHTQKKVEAKAVWPRDQDGRHMSLCDWGIIPYAEVDPHTIGFAWRKSAKAIQRDLERRLLPGMVEKAQEIAAKLAERLASKDTIAQDAQKIADVTTWRWDDQVRDVSPYSAKVLFDGGQARVSKENGGSKVDLDLKSLPMDKALEILAILGE